ncbi:MAG: acyl-CoA reductase [Myxococcota bacterium]
MRDGPPEIRSAAAAALHAGQALRSRTVEARARWIAEAADRLMPSAKLGANVVRTLPDETGLSAPMVAWALRTTLETVDVEPLVRLARAASSEANEGSAPLRLLSIVLAGNVFTAVARGAAIPLLLGVPVVVKTSSRQTQFPQALKRALETVDQQLGAAMQVVTFAGGDEACNEALVESADAVSVFGSDETVSAIRRRAGGRVPIQAHGHGMSAGYCSATALGEGQFDETADVLALDVAAYDQRGCLSPSVVFVEGTASAAVAFGVRLSKALGDLEDSLPRGELPADVAAAQLQWRGLAEVEGTLLRGGTHAVAVVPEGFSLGPGSRNVAIVPVSGVGGAIEAMRGYARHLKCVGCDRASLPTVARGLTSEADYHAYATPLGTMQTPSIDAPQDGRPVFEGYLRPAD